MRPRVFLDICNPFLFRSGLCVLTSFTVHLRQCFLVSQKSHAVVFLRVSLRALIFGELFRNFVFFQDSATGEVIGVMQLVNKRDGSSAELLRTHKKILA